MTTYKQLFDVFEAVAREQLIPAAQSRGFTLTYDCESPLIDRRFELTRERWRLVIAANARDDGGIYYFHHADGDSAFPPLAIPSLILLSDPGFRANTGFLKESISQGLRSIDSFRMSTGRLASAFREHLGQWCTQELPNWHDTWRRMTPPSRVSSIAWWIEEESR